jgi:hypothetical protein
VRAHNLLARRFGLWRVVERAPSIKAKSAWRCICDCGVERIVVGSNLTQGLSQSCGCRGTGAKRPERHGWSKTPEYRVWRDMRSRCEIPSHPSFPDYGGRGIGICDRWRESFEAFLTDMGARPLGRFSIDRRDNNGNYNPSNCYWATAEEQSSNTRQNVFVEIEGERLTLSQASRKFDISLGALKYRLNAGWETSAALRTRSQRRASAA